MATPHLVRLLISALCSACPLTVAADQIALSSVSVHLFLEGKGEFTGDVTAMTGFGAWNFRPFANGEDFGIDNFHSFLVKMVFTARAEAFEVGKVADITVSDTTDRKIILRRKVSGLYIGANGQTTVPILISGHECETLKIVVRTKAVTIQKQLHFACGE